ncbi:unnamed protein product [Durusdinium trenchii]|uniref:Kinesin motor domain-containing protein n=1 Tax=Durusdinium trenchii TaxID=1381693 RepID=A0ABP0I9E8_9DINO
MAENIHVAIRIRPMSENEEITSTCAICVPTSQPTVVVQASDGQIKSFTYDHCFSSLEPSNDTGTQDAVYTEFGADLVKNVLEGYNCCLFAYGQTGAGKSHTMMGYGDQPGVIPRSVEDLFGQKGQLRGDELRVWCSFVEIYNEQIRDLLEPSGLRQETQSSLRIMDHPALGVIIPGLVEAACQTVLEVKKLIKFGLKKRVTSATIMNNTSSRSHAVFIIKVQRVAGEGRVDSTNARMNLVDLAGSERHKAAFIHGATFKEGCAINQSLSALALVIKELGEQQARSQIRQRTRSFSGALPMTATQTPMEGKEVVPFRSSKLTFLLRDSLAGNSRSRMVAAVSPAACNVDETISTLRFASSVKKVKTSASVNVDQRMGVVQHLQAEVRRLKALLAARGVEVDALGAGSVQQEIADREHVLKTLRQSYTVQLEEAQLLASARQEALDQQGLSSEDVDEVFGLEKNTPHLLNMSDDPVLSGCLVYFLPKGQLTKLGSHPENQIVIKGLGISDFVCHFRNPDQRQVVISVPREDVSERSRVLVNGQLLKPDEVRRLKHFDRLLFGRAWMMRLVVPLEQQDLAANKSLSNHSDTDSSEDVDVKVIKKRSMLKHDTMKLILNDESEAWSELRLYLGDLWERLGEERGNEFFYYLSKAAYLVDEANDITTEMRSEDRLKFEVELVWDIHRHVSDIIIIIRITQWSADGQDASVLSYWTVDSFKQRLEMMRDCYDTFCSKGRWTGKGDPLEDPWMDPSTVELIVQMHKSVEEQLRIEELRQSLLSSKLENGNKTGAGDRSQALSAAHSRQSSKRLQGVSTVSSRQSSKLFSNTPSVVNSGRSSLTGKEVRAIGRLGLESEPASRTSSKHSVSVGGPTKTLTPRKDSRPASPPPTLPPAPLLAAPHSAPATLREATAGSRAEESKDAEIQALRQQLKEKEDVECTYKDRIQGMVRQLQELQKRHGPLRDLLGGVQSEGSAPTTRRLNTFPGGGFHSSGSEGRSGVFSVGGGLVPLLREVREPLARPRSPSGPAGTSTAPLSPPHPMRTASVASNGYSTMPLPSPRSPNSWVHYTPRALQTLV